MLFREAQHADIASGAITQTVRVWKRPKVKVGGRYSVWTIGLVEVDAVDRVRVAALSDEDARQSGFDGVAALRAELERTARRALADEEELVRVRFHYVGPDERERPGDRADLDDEAVALLVAKLDGMDRRSGRPWTRDLLRAIADAPGRGSKLLAVDLDRDRMKLKADVRKLKRLGLTESLDVGYRLSPRGRAFWERTGR